MFTPALLYKIFLSLTAPLLGAVVGLIAFEHLHVPSWIVLPSLLAIVYFAGVCLVFALKALAMKKIQAGKDKYRDKNFSQLKDLYIANPHEAALYIDVKSRQQLLCE